MPLKISKVCLLCQEEKQVSEFYVKRYKTREYLYSRCKKCENENTKSRYSAQRDYTIKLKRNYDLSWEEYENLYTLQNKVCAICKTSILLSGQTTNKAEIACVDHDHKTGKVRGLLCDGCNKGLGQFKDKKESLLQAAEYLNASN